jgi:hypothetical protein
MPDQYRHLNKQCTSNFHHLGLNVDFVQRTISILFFYLYKIMVGSGNVTGVMFFGAKILFGAREHQNLLSPFRPRIGLVSNRQSAPFVVAATSVSQEAE